MNLIIDEEKIDFKLEEEKNLLDIIRSIENYLSANKRHITKVVMNNDIEIDIDDEMLLKDCSVENIDDLKIFSNTPFGTAIESLVEIKAYVERFLSYIDSDIKKITLEKREAVEGLRWVANGTIGAIFMIGMIDSFIFYKTSFLKDKYNELIKCSHTMEENENNLEIFQQVLKDDVKIILGDFLEFINIIGLRIYFNLLYNKDKDVFISKTKELFKLIDTSINELSNNTEKLIETLKSDNTDEKLKNGQIILNILINSISDIFHSSNVLSIDMSNFLIDGKFYIDYCKNIMITLDKMEKTLFGNKYSEFVSLVEKNMHSIIKNISIIIKEIIIKLENQG